MENFIGLVFIIGISVLGYAAIQGYNERHKPSELGRYQIIVQNEYLSFLLDTKTGDTYAWTNIKDEDGKDIGKDWRYKENSMLDVKRALVAH